MAWVAKHRSECNPNEPHCMKNPRAGMGVAGPVRTDARPLKISITERRQKVHIN